MPKTLNAEEDGKGSLCALYRKETWSPKLEQAPRQCRRKHTLRSVSVRTCVTDTLACTRAALTLPQLKFFVHACTDGDARDALLSFSSYQDRGECFSGLFYIYIIRDFSYLPFFPNYFYYKYVSTGQIIFYYFKLNFYLFGNYSREDI